MKKIISRLLLIVVLASSIACSFPGLTPEDDGAKMNIGVMSGPTGMGMAKLMKDNAESTEKYAFELYSSPQDAMADLLSCELDLLCLPTNTAATLYNKNENIISVLAINTLGSLYLLSDESTTITSVSDLAGKTIYTSVASSTTVPILNAILEKNGVSATVEVEADHDSLVSRIAKGEVSLAVLPEPKVTAALMQNATYSVDLNLSSEWDKVFENSLTMGCIVVRNEFLNAHEGAVQRFLHEYEESINYIANPENLDSAAQMICDVGVIPKLPIAKKSLSNLKGSIVYLDGEDMKMSLVEFYNVLLESMPQSIANKLPGDSFYYGT